VPEEAKDPATTPFVVILNWQRLLEDRSALSGWAHDLPKMQSPDAGVEGTHLPQAAEVEMPAVRQDQDAEAGIENRDLTSALTGVGFLVAASIGHQSVRARASRQPSRARRISVWRSKRRRTGRRSRC
jgi:hypothetical protein